MYQYDPDTGRYETVPRPLAPPPPSFNQPPYRKATGHRWVLGIAAVFGILAACGATVDGPEPIDPPTTSTTAEVGLIPPASEATEPPTTTTTRPVTTTTESAADQMGAWYRAHGVILDDLTAEISTIAEAANDLDMAAVMVSCGGLADVIADARDLPPMPDPGVNGHWQTALAAYGNGADACQTGDLELAGTYIVDGNEAIAAASASIEGML